MSELHRRHLLTGAGIGLGAAALSACGDDGSVAGSDPSAAPSSASTAPSAASTTGTPQPTDPPAAAVLAKVSEVPVGGGIILADEELVLTQPTAGDVRAFSAHCTHQGCLVTGITSTIDCSCHGSKFDLGDGSPVAGPATAPLPAETVTVEGDSVVRG